MGRIAAELGTPFMPWQQQVADVALEINPDTGLLAYRDCRLTVPRQSGKTTEVLSLVLHRALGSPRQNIVYGAQTGKDARKKWEDDWLPILDHSRFKGFYRKRLANGREGLTFVNGSMQGILASSDDAGHGGTLDLGIDDEAFAEKDARREQACVPAMNTRPQPQWWVISTAGTPKKSPYLYGKVLSGRQLVEKGTNTGICYFEWSAPDDADPFDPRVWWDCMPALGYTVKEATVSAALETMLADPKMGLNEFKRAYLNQWVLAMGDPIVSLDHWRNLARVDAPRPPWVVLGLSVAPEDASASVVACGEDGHGGLQCAVLEHGEGIDWMLPSPEGGAGSQEGLGGPVGALAALVEKYQPQAVVVNEKECAHLLPEIERVCGYDRVRKVRSGQMAGASAFWLRLVKNKRAFHRDEAELTVALAAAERRNALDTGWVFSAAKSNADITPLQAMVLGCSYWLGAYGEDD